MGLPRLEKPPTKKNMKEAEEAAERWCDGTTVFRDDIDIKGSPARSMERHAVECGGLFVLEKIPWKKMAHGKKEAETMEYFGDNGLPVLRYLKNREKSYFSQVNGHIWMLREYVLGSELPRPDFIDQGWRGLALADFLIRMRSLSHNLEGETFSLKSFVEGQRRKIGRRYPDMDRRLSPVYSYIADFMENYESLPLAFNHGDFHPINIIWSENGIKAVIDWEFMGRKPELYDAANMVGCAGMENPRALSGEFVGNFIDRLRRRGDFSSLSWDYFPQLLVALRFAWLNDWILFRDSEMMALEVSYMNLLVENPYEI